MIHDRFFRRYVVPLSEDNWDHQKLEEQHQEKYPSSVMRCMTCTARVFQGCIL